MAEAFRERVTFWVRGDSSIKRYCWNGVIAHPATLQVINATPAPTTADIEPASGASREKESRGSATTTKITVMLRP